MVVLRTLAFVLAAAAAAPSHAETVLVLVRHGEKVDESEDPELSDAGRRRARTLARMLKDAGIEAVYSTDFIRTRETARPTAELVGKPVEIYDVGDLAVLAKSLRSRDARALVVGHSNTIPDLVRSLGGDAGPEIASDEYDRLYILNLGAEDHTSTTVLRLPQGATP
ncbi:MAG: SixA phosphatase family protein [Vicinamibacteria bacterium]